MYVLGQMKNSTVRYGASRLGFYYYFFPLKRGLRIFKRIDFLETNYLQLVYSSVKNFRFFVLHTLYSKYDNLLRVEIC